MCFNTSGENMGQLTFQLRMHSTFHAFFLDICEYLGFGLYTPHIVGHKLEAMIICMLLCLVNVYLLFLIITL